MADIKPDDPIEIKKYLKYTINGFIFFVVTSLIECGFGLSELYLKHRDGWFFMGLGVVMLVGWSLLGGSQVRNANAGLRPVPEWSGAPYKSAPFQTWDVLESELTVVLSRQRSAYFGAIAFSAVALTMSTGMFVFVTIIGFRHPIIPTFIYFIYPLICVLTLPICFLSLYALRKSIASMARGETVTFDKRDRLLKKDADELESFDNVRVAIRRGETSRTTITFYLVLEIGQANDRKLLQLGQGGYAETRSLRPFGNYLAAVMGHTLVDTSGGERNQ